MQKLFSYSKYAAIAAIVLLILTIINRITPLWSMEYQMDKFSMFPIQLLGILNSAIICVFFVLICKYSVKGSKVKIPAIIGLTATSLSIVASFLRCFPYRDIFFLTHYIISILSMVGLLVALIMLSKSFNNKLVSTFAILLASFPIVIVIIDYIIVATENYIYYASIYPIILVCLKYIAEIGFFFFFSKLSK